VGIEKDPEDARPFIEVAKPSHPSLIDTEHLLPDLYNWVNVPTVTWIDERGRIVRPNDVAFGNNQWKQVTGFDAGPHANALRAWVKGEWTHDDTWVRERQTLPAERDQLARAHFGLGWWLHKQGRAQAAERHFLRAGELAPHDFMIRRGSLPIRGLSSAGPEFFQMTREWAAAGHQYYVPIRE
jgi:hypothetical protein